MVTESALKQPASALFGKTRRAVLSLLYGHDEAFYLRQIVRATGVGLGPAQRELKRLSDAGIARRTVRGRQVYYQANPDSPLFGVLKNIVALMEQTSFASGGASKPASPAALRFPVSQSHLAVFCRKHHVKKLSLFGSVLRDDFRPDSDIDVLVEFEEGHVPGFLGLADMESELAALFDNRKVDLRTPQELSPYFRDEVVKGAKVLCQ